MIYIFNAIPINIPEDFFLNKNIDKVIPKFISKGRELEYQNKFEKWTKLED